MEENINKTKFIRVEKTDNYSIIHNGFLRRADLSWKAKGILTYILSLPDDWNINLNELMRHATEGKAAFRSGWKELETLGYVDRVPVRDETGKISFWETVVRENIDVEPSSPLPDFQEVDNQHLDNRKLLSTYNTNYLNNKDSPAEAAPPIPYQKVIEYLNKKADRSFKHTTKKTQSLIRARFNEGFKLDDFKKVIDVKSNQWINDKGFKKYLRPETLFGTKFESYLNEAPATTKKPKAHEKDYLSEIEQLMKGDC